MNSKSRPFFPSSEAGGDSQQETPSIDFQSPTRAVPAPFNHLGQVGRLYPRCRPPSHPSKSSNTSNQVAQGRVGVWHLVAICCCRRHVDTHSSFT